MWLFLMACMTEEHFQNQFVVQGCGRSLECDKSSFEKQYDDLADCEEQSASMVDDVAHCFEDCEFDPEGASDEIHNYKEADCADREFDLFNAYQCDDEFSVALCIGLDLAF